MCVYAALTMILIRVVKLKVLGVCGLWVRWLMGLHPLRHSLRRSRARPIATLRCSFP